MVPQDNFGVFQQKLSGYYEKFRIRPNNDWCYISFDIIWINLYLNWMEGKSVEQIIQEALQTLTVSIEPRTLPWI